MAVCLIPDVQDGASCLSERTRASPALQVVMTDCQQTPQAPEITPLTLDSLSPFPFSQPPIYQLSLSSTLSSVSSPPSLHIHHTWILLRMLLRRNLRVLCMRRCCGRERWRWRLQTKLPLMPGQASSPVWNELKVYTICQHNGTYPFNQLAILHSFHGLSYSI